MPRPWVSKRIDELEQLFKSSGEDPITLHALEHELAYRQTQRALKLSSAVRERVAMPDLADRRVQGSLFGPEPTSSGLPQSRETDADENSPSVRRDQNRDTQARNSAARNGVRSGELIPFPASTAVAPQTNDFAMPVEEACRVLNVPSSADWEKVEYSRREIVERSRPDRLSACTPQQRHALLLAAHRANRAAGVLSRLRIEMNSRGNQSSAPIAPSSEVLPITAVRATN
jgi:DnaJ-domain-containing protein 1